MPRIILCWLALAAAVALSACSDKDAPPATAAPESATSTVPPTAESTATPLPTPLPTVPASTLGLRAVEVATGRNVTLPVEFGRASAWSRDSTYVAVAGAGLAVGRTDGTPFRNFWPSACFGVEWSPTADVVGAICRDAAVMFDASGRLMVSVPVSNASFSSKQPSVAWSPDGKLLAYGPVDGAIRFLVASGQPPSELKGTFTGFQWMTDGRLVSFEQPYYQYPAVVRLYAAAPGFNVIAEFTTPAEAYGVGVDPRTGLLTYALYGPRIGSRRVLSSTVYTVRLADGQAVATYDNAYLAEYASGPSFGLDGHLAAMSNFCEPTSWSIDILARDGTRATVDRGGAMRIKFSPDGRWVAFTRGVTLWVVVSDGSSAARQIADDVHGPAEFWWSPDSKWISVPPYFGGFDQCP